MNLTEKVFCNGHRCRAGTGPPQTRDSLSIIGSMIVAEAKDDSQSLKVEVGCSRRVCLAILITKTAKVCMDYVFVESVRDHQWMTIRDGSNFRHVHAALVQLQAVNSDSTMATS